MRLHETIHDELAQGVVDQFHEQTKTAQGTPLFKRLGPTSVLLKRLVVEALQETDK